MTDRYGTLFWLAVAVLAVRALSDLGQTLSALARGLKTVLRVVLVLLFSHPARPARLAEAPAPMIPPPTTVPPREATALSVSNYLESMTHEEMDELLSA